MVLQVRDDQYGTQHINMNCRLEKLGRKVVELDNDKKQILKDMGFGGLMDFAGKMLPRRICYWLMTRLCERTCKLETCDGKKFPLSPNQMNWILGTPVGKKPVPKLADADEDRLEAIQALRTKYLQVCGQVDENGRATLGIPLSRIESELDRPLNSDEDVKEFRTTMLMFVLATIIAPTTCPRFRLSELCVVTVANEDCDQYDWSSYSLDHVKHAVDVFLEKFKEDAYVSGVSGCVIFLAILYLDRLDRLPIKWGQSPCIKFWTTKEMNKAAREDLTKTGDYGRLGTLDVAYSEIHPHEARDLPVSDSYPNQQISRLIGNRNDLVMRQPSMLLRQGLEQIDEPDFSRVLKPRKGPTGPCPYEKRLAKARTRVNLTIEEPQSSHDASSSIVKHLENISDEGVGSQNVFDGFGDTMFEGLSGRQSEVFHGGEGSGSAFDVTVYYGLRNKELRDLRNEHHDENLYSDNNNELDVREPIIDDVNVNNNNECKKGSTTEINPQANEMKKCMMPEEIWLDDRRRMNLLSLTHLS